MYAVIGKNRLTISVAEFYAMHWYERDYFPSHKEKFPFDYGQLEIDIHKNGRKYVTGFTLATMKRLLSAKVTGPMI